MPGLGKKIWSPYKLSSLVKCDHNNPRILINAFKIEILKQLWIKLECFG